MKIGLWLRNSGLLMWEFMQESIFLSDTVGRYDYWAAVGLSNDEIRYIILWLGPRPWWDSLHHYPDPLAG